MTNTLSFNNKQITDKHMYITMYKRCDICFSYTFIVKEMYIVYMNLFNVSMI